MKRAKRVSVVIDGKLRWAKVLDDNLPSLMGGGKLLLVEVEKRQIAISSDSIIKIKKEVKK